MIDRLAAALVCATFSLAGAQAEAPWCPQDRTQAECDAVWAASQAMAASAHLSDEEQVDAASGAYLAAQAQPAKPAPYLPPHARLKMLNEVSDLLARASGQPVVVRRAVYYLEGEGLLCGQAFFDMDLQGFVLGGDTFQRGLSKDQMEELGCFKRGGVVLAP